VDRRQLAYAHKLLDIGRRASMSEPSGYGHSWGRSGAGALGTDVTCSRPAKGGAVLGVRRVDGVGRSRPEQKPV